MYRKIHSVQLEYTEDYKGAAGYLPQSVCNSPNCGNFDAALGPILLFHDVFEHYFEGVHKYFSGDYAFNTAGEIAAAGASIYYADVLQVSDRGALRGAQWLTHNKGIYEPEAFGGILKCNVPTIKLDANHTPDLRAYAEVLYKDLLQTVDEDQFRATSDYNAYIQSITPSKIYKLVAYGYRMANKLVPMSYLNGEILNEFIDQFDQFFKIANRYDLDNTTLQVDVYRDSSAIMWKARIFDHYENTIIEKFECS
jgi:hypothetical protein